MADRTVIEVLDEEFWEVPKRGDVNPIGIDYWIRKAKEVGVDDVKPDVVVGDKS